MSKEEIKKYAKEFMYTDTKEIQILQPYILIEIIDLLQQENQASKQTINELSNQIAKLVEEKDSLKAKLDILTTNYKTLSADIGTVAEYMKLNNEAIIEEMIDRVLELVKKEDIIDELEKWLMDENNQKYSKDIWNYSVNSWFLTKLQELKGSDK